MADLDVIWAGINLHDYMKIEELTGWDDLPDITSYDQSRSRGHGDHVGDQFARSRIVTASGSILSSAARDALALALMGVSPVSSTVTNLAATTFGRTLSTGARLIARSLPVKEDYAAGVVPVALQWRCPDPLRYGPSQTAGPIGLPTSGGGIVYPLTYGITYGTQGVVGHLTLTNPGTADTSVVFTVTGSLPSGFSITSSDGQLLTYPEPLAAGEVLTLDTATGFVLLGGTSDRRSNLTNADWMQVPAGGSLTVSFASLGGTYDPAATLTATTRPAYW